MGGNQTWVTDFILVGLQLSTEMGTFFFWIFSLLYMFSLLANGIILVLIYLNPSLHTPMYFFLTHLAILDISYASNNVPKMLVNLITQNKNISFVPCITQTFLYLAFAASECLILATKSYDRFVAICHPLHYTIIMSWKVCVALAATSWSCGFLSVAPICGSYNSPPKDALLWAPGGEPPLL